ncbi:Sugar transporter [Popillia japonica]|uniref:Sugar transporter n=1 Tax=Popillia japonica TaxID=7064 RepID=A0AAW1JF03_POPJA
MLQVQVQGTYLHRDNLHGPISKLRSDVAQIVAVCIKNMLLLSFGPISKLRSDVAQIVAVCIKNMLLLSFGLTLGFPTILIPGLQQHDPESSFELSRETISWIGSINLICVPIGCACSGAITEYLGRKKCMQLVNIPFLCAWIMFKYTTSIYLIFLALCLTGLSGGLLEAPVITYVAEICQPRLRGMLSSTSTLSVMGGVLIQFLFGTFFHWRTVALINCIFPVLSFVLLFFVPESPHWLILKNRLLDARKSIAWLRGWTSLEAIEPEFKDLCRYIANQDQPVNGNTQTQTEMKPMTTKPEFKDLCRYIANQDQPVNGNTQTQTEMKPMTVMEKIRLFRKKNFLWPYAVVTFCFFLHQFRKKNFTGVFFSAPLYWGEYITNLCRSNICQFTCNHFTGVNTLQTYAVQIFASLHAPINNYVATVYLGIAEVVGCLVCILAITKIGKRRLNFFSLIGLGLCFILIATYAYIIDVKELINLQHNVTIANNTDTISKDQYSWIPLTLIILAAFISHMGIRILPWILTGELYSNETRAAASGLSGAIAYIFGFLSNKTFLSLIELLTLPGMFWFYSAISLVGCALLYVILPETEGKPLHEITDHFKGLKRLTNSVRRKDKSGKNGKINEAYRMDAIETSKIENHI